MTTATEVGDVQMQTAKVVGLATAADEPFHDVVLEEWQASGSLPSRSATPRPSAWRLA